MCGSISPTLLQETKSLVSMLRGTQTLREIRFENGDPIIIQWEPTAEERCVNKIGGVLLFTQRVLCLVYAVFSSGLGTCLLMLRSMQ